MIMKKDVKGLLLVMLFTMLSFSAQAQETQDVKESPMYKLENIKYQLGLKYGDANVARSALYSMLVMDPQNLSLLDSLAYLYYDYQRYTSCILVCMDLLKINPNHLPALEMSAISYESLGLKDKALENFESIYLKQSNIYTLYKVAALQLDLGRYLESMTNVDILLKNEEIKESKMTINTDQGTQEIAFTAAVYNLKGLIESNQEQKEAAKASFNQALSIEPGFALAKSNLAELDK